MKPEGSLLCPEEPSNSETLCNIS